MCSGLSETLDFTGSSDFLFSKLYFFYMDIQSFLYVKHFILLFFTCHFSCDTLRHFPCDAGAFSHAPFPFKKFKTRKAGDML